MTFVDFIQRRNITGSRRGDFIADSKTLINAGVFPGVKAWADLYRFLSRRRTSDETIIEARRLWRAYLKATALEGKLS